MEWKDKSKDFMAELDAIVTKKLMAAGIIIEGNIKRVITAKGIVDTGRLRSSVSWILDDGKSGDFGLDSPVGKPSRDATTRAVRVGTNVEYAPHHEFGTTKMKARPYMRPGFEKSKKDIGSIFHKKG